MAHEIQAQTTTGQTIYAVLLNSSGQIWNGTTFVTINGANWTAYDIALTEAAGGLYLGDMPAIGAGAYQFTAYAQAGASPATSDTQVDTGSIAWDGSAVVAPSAGYTTVAAVKTYLGISGAGDDTLLATLVAAARSQIEAKTGRVFEATADTTRYLDAVADVDGPYLLLRGDLCAITSVTNGDGTTVTSGEYFTVPLNATPYYALKLRGTSGNAWTYTTDPENAITVVGRWAYSLTPPADIVQAATRLAAYLYCQKDAQVFDVTAQPDMGIITVPQGIPRDVQMLLAPYVGHL